MFVLASSVLTAPVLATETENTAISTTVESTDQTKVSEKSTTATTRKEHEPSKNKSSVKSKKKKRKSKEKDRGTTSKTASRKKKPMPKRPIKIKGCKSIRDRIKKLKRKIQIQEKKKKMLEQRIQTEKEKSVALEQFYQKLNQYKTEQAVNGIFLGKKMTPVTKLTKQDRALRKDLCDLASVFSDPDLYRIANEYVFGFQENDFSDILNLKEETLFDLNSYLKQYQIASFSEIEKEVKNIDQKISTYKKQIKKEKEERFFDPNNVSSVSNITVDDAKKMLGGTALYQEAESFVKAERLYDVNAVFLMGIAAHESAWGTSRRAREDNNLTGYGVYSDSSKGINKQTKEEGLLATAETLHERYLTKGGNYYEGTSITDVNKHYCVGDEWASAVANYAYQLMKKI